MLGLVINLWDAHLPPDSPWRTREEYREQPAVFVSKSGRPVFEVWFWHAQRRTWFVWSQSFDLRLAHHGVRYFATMEQLKEMLRPAEAA